MKIKIILLLFCSILFSGGLFNDGVEHYNKRSDKIDGLYASTVHIDKAIKLFESDLNNNENVELILYLLKSYYFKGEYVLKDKDSKKDIFDKGKKLAEKYILIHPESAGIRYWYLVNLGKWAEVYGIFKAAREGVSDIMKTQSEKIIELDSNYKDGGGYFMLGAVHLKSPYIPFLLSWPDKNKAVEYFKLAMNTGRQSLAQKKYLADALYETGSIDQAKKILEEIISSTPSPEDRLEDLNDIHEAQELLKTF